MVHLLVTLSTQRKRGSLSKSPRKDDRCLVPQLANRSSYQNLEHNGQRKLKNFLTANHTQPTVLSLMAYLSRTTPDIEQLLQLELTGRDAPNDLERRLFALPARLGGLNIGNPALLADEQYTSSQQVTKPLVEPRKTKITLTKSSYTKST